MPNPFASHARRRREQIHSDPVALPSRVIRLDSPAVQGSSFHSNTPGLRERHADSHEPVSVETTLRTSLICLAPGEARGEFFAFAFATMKSMQQSYEMLSCALRSMTCSRHFCTRPILRELTNTLGVSVASRLIDGHSPKT